MIDQGIGYRVKGLGGGGKWQAMPWQRPQSPPLGKGMCLGSGHTVVPALAVGGRFSTYSHPWFVLPWAAYERGVQLLAGHHPAYLRCRGFAMRTKATVTSAGYDGYIPTGPGAKEAELS